jgi:hypothetical protein
VAAVGQARAPVCHQRRDTRPPAQLRAFTYLQRMALRDVVNQDEHGLPYVDYRDGQVRR